MNMNFLDILFISISLAMDAFSISLSKGLSMTYKYKRNFFLISLSFSIFQMIMPLIGYLFGSKINKYFLTFNHIISFLILFFIGINMINNSFKKENINVGLSIKELLMLSIATSIDAMIVGITFSLFNINLLKTILIIGIITFILCIIGIKIGKYLSNKYESISKILGGIILIIISLKNLLDYFI